MRRLLLIFLPACGRLGFDAISPAVGDGRLADGSSSIDATACSQLTSPDWLGGAMPRDAQRMYATSVDGMTITDEVSGLRWQSTVPASLYTAAQAASYCASLTLDGCSHWRLPQRVELITLVDHAQILPVIDPAFASTPTDTPYWTATPNTSANNIWVVNFYNGNTFWDAVSTTLHVRCVHSELQGSLPPARYTAGVNSVLDVQTGLIWTRAISGAQTQAGAISYCQGLTTDGASWRLPEVDELETLVDTSTSSPAIDATAFPGTPSAVFWSSSTYGPGASMIVDFTSGGIVNAPPSDMNVARCVH